MILSVGQALPDEVLTVKFCLSFANFQYLKIHQAKPDLPV